MKSKAFRRLALSNTPEFTLPPFAPSRPSHVTSTLASPFSRALSDESRWLCNVVERPFPSDYLAGKRIYIGPALPPANALHYLGLDASRE